MESKRWWTSLAIQRSRICGPSTEKKPWAIVDGRIDTAFLETELDGLLADTADTVDSDDDDRPALALAAALALHDRLEPMATSGFATTGRADDPWTTLGGWRLS